MSRALVLGGGGPVGIGWESGLVIGLAEHGVDLGRADRIIGTSAGSVVGAQLALGLDLEVAARALDATRRPATELPASGTPGADVVDTAPSSGGSMAERMQRLMDAMAKAASSSAPPEEVRAEIGRLALETDGLDEETFVGFFAMVKDRPWPARFACTTIDALTGEFVVWEQSSGIDLQLGVASSCSVPCVYPPVTIGGRRYIDGGMRSGLNADIAAGHDAVLVVSVMVLELPPGVTNPMFDRMRSTFDGEMAALEAAGARTTTIQPGAEFLEVSGWGTRLMDAGQALAAFEAGRRQGAEEAVRVAELWNT